MHSILCSQRQRMGWCQSEQLTVAVGTLYGECLPNLSAARPRGAGRSQGVVCRRQSWHGPPPARPADWPSAPTCSGPRAGRRSATQGGVSEAAGKRLAGGWRAHAAPAWGSGGRTAARSAAGPAASRRSSPRSSALPSSWRCVAGKSYRPRSRSTAWPLSLCLSPLSCFATASGPGRRPPPLERNRSAALRLLTWRSDLTVGAAWTPGRSWRSWRSGGKTCPRYYAWCRCWWCGGASIQAAWWRTVWCGCRLTSLSQVSPVLLPTVASTLKRRPAARRRGRAGNVFPDNVSERRTSRKHLQRQHRCLLPVRGEEASTERLNTERRTWHGSARQPVVLQWTWLPCSALLCPLADPLGPGLPGFSSCTETLRCRRKGSWRRLRWETKVRPLWLRYQPTRWPHSQTQTPLQAPLWLAPERRPH